MMAAYSPVHLEKLGHLRIARDDLLEGGSKRRALIRWLPHIVASTFVYPSTIYGLAGLALAHACADTGKKAVLLYSKPKTRPPVFDRLEALGATIVITDEAVPLAQLENMAQAYAQAHGAYCVPAGCNHPDFITHMADVLKTIDYTPQEVWVAAVTGTLARAAQLAWPAATHHAVCVVKTPEDIGYATAHFSAQKYHQNATEPPPYPAHPQCDAKLWAFAKKHAKNGALIWNIGA